MVEEKVAGIKDFLPWEIDHGVAKGVGLTGMDKLNGTAAEVEGHMVPVGNIRGDDSCCLEVFSQRGAHLYRAVDN